VVALFELIDDVQQSKSSSISLYLLRVLSPANASIYKKILEYICTRIAEEISKVEIKSNAFELKLVASNILAESGYNGLKEIIENLDIVSDRLATNGPPDFEDVFLFMFPNEDDYWSGN